MHYAYDGDQEGNGFPVNATKSTTSKGHVRISRGSRWKTSTKVGGYAEHVRKSPPRVESAGGVEEVNYVGGRARGEDRWRNIRREDTTVKCRCNTVKYKEELREYVKRESVDIWCIQETKLIEKDKTPQVQGYTVTRKDRTQARGRESNRGGGLLVRLKEEIPYKVIQKEFREPEDNITEG